MWFGWSNPETLETFKAHYKPKVALLILLYLIQPRASTPSAISSTESSRTEIVQRTTIDLHLPHGLKLNVGGLGVSTHGASMQGGVETTEPKVPPMTETYVKGRHDHLPFVQSTEHIEGGVSMHPKHSTLSSTYTAQLTQSFVLSPPPAPSTGYKAASVFVKSKIMKQESKQAFVEAKSGNREVETKLASSTVDSDKSPDCPTDFRGRPQCPNSTRLPLSLSDRSSELADAVHEFGLWVINLVPQIVTLTLTLRLSPFCLAALLFHVLLGVQLASLWLEDAIVRVGLSNPMPKDFPRANTLGKRLSRFKWRAKATAQRWGTHMLGIAASLIVVTLVGWQCWQSGLCTDWDDVPFGQWLLSNTCKAHTGGSSTTSPLREMIALETIGTFFSLAQPLKHLLPASIVPPTISPQLSFSHSKPEKNQAPSRPSFFPSTAINGSSPTGSSQALPKASGAIRLSTIYTLSLLSEGIFSALTLLQFMRLAFLLPSYSPLTVPPHILFHCVRSRVLNIQHLRQTLLRTIECLETVFRVFPDSVEVGGVSARAGEAKDDEDWVCTICFEGEGGSSLSTGAVDNDNDVVSVNDGQERSEKSKCRLGCGHKYHAGCLVHWCHHQNWCPVCHVPVVAASNAASNTTGTAAHPAASIPGSVATPSMFMPLAQPEPDLSDIYPANLRRRRAVLDGLPTPGGPG